MKNLKLDYIKFLYNFWLFRKKQKKNHYISKKSEFINKRFDLLKKKKKLILATQVGRGGGKWLIDIINSIDGVYAYGERNRSEESYFRYLRSFNDHSYDSKMIKIIKSEAINDWDDNDISYISSPYFSHGLSILDKKLKPDKIVILIPSFKHLTRSFKNKNWFDNKNLYIKKIKKIPKDFQKNPNHFYGRYINLGLDRKKLYKLSQLEKISSFITKTLERIYNECKKIEHKKIKIFELEKADQNYEYCKNFVKKININLLLSKKKFLKLKYNTSNKYENEKIDINKFEIKWINKNNKKFNFIKKKFLNKYKN